MLPALHWGLCGRVRRWEGRPACNRAAATTATILRACRRSARCQSETAGIETEGGRLGEQAANRRPQKQIGWAAAATISRSTGVGQRATCMRCPHAALAHQTHQQAKHPLAQRLHGRILRPCCLGCSCAADLTPAGSGALRAAHSGPSHRRRIRPAADALLPGAGRRGSIHHTAQGRHLPITTCTHLAPHLGLLPMRLIS